MSIVVSTDPVAEAVARALSGFCGVPPAEQEKMIRRAAAVAKLHAFRTCVSGGLLMKLARKWRRDCGRPGGASIDAEAASRGRDEAKRQCASELESVVSEYTIEG